MKYDDWLMNCTAGQRVDERKRTLLTKPNEYQRDLATALHRPMPVDFSFPSKSSIRIDSSNTKIRSSYIRAMNDSEHSRERAYFIVYFVSLHKF